MNHSDRPPSIVLGLRSFRTLMLPILLGIGASVSHAAEYYVAPTGSDTNAGTLAQPFESIQRAQAAAAAGDTVWIRGGTYRMRENQIARLTGIFAYVTLLDKSGTSTNRIKYWAYQNERPVFDYTDVKPANYRVHAFEVTGSWIHIKGIEVVGVQVTILTHTQSICFSNNGSNNIFENLSMHDGQAIGFYGIKGSKNLILNCDAYRNYDYTSENGRGGNTDGFGYHCPAGATGNVFRGCRAWFNSDDGYDLINAFESVTFDNCWAAYNGRSPDGQSRGDGHGFKAGGYGAPFDKIPNPIPRHLIKQCVSVANKTSGFYANHHVGGNDWYNNTAYKNPTNYNMLNRLADNSADTPGFDHIMKNNLGFLGNQEITNWDASKNVHENNYFDLPVNIATNDFVSLDEAQLFRPRTEIGGLPKISFLHLDRESDLIDKGVPLPFTAAKPDLGAFESGDRFPARTQTPPKVTPVPRPPIAPKPPARTPALPPSKSN